MEKINVKDFSIILKRHELYAIKATEGEDGIKVYPFSKWGIEAEIIMEMPYSYEQWINFLKRHNCQLEGDDRWEFHQEMEDGIKFEISAGLDEMEDCRCDFFRIL